MPAVEAVHGSRWEEFRGWSRDLALHWGRRHGLWRLRALGEWAGWGNRLHGRVAGRQPNRQAEWRAIAIGNGPAKT